jgi:uncharacterized membrane protein
MLSGTLSNMDPAACIKVILFMLFADAVWLTTMRPMYAQLVQSVQGTDLRLRIVPSVIAYVFVVFAFVFLCAARITRPPGGGGRHAFVIGCAVGLAIYGVFNATNAAIFSGYTLVPAIADTVWGTVLFGTASLLYYKMCQHPKK